MYLSRIRLNPGLPTTVQALTKPSMFHGAIEEAFGREDKRHLWRIDRLKGYDYLMIVSESLPDFTILLSQFGFSDDRGEFLSYDKFLSKIENGSKWKFKLTANPAAYYRDLETNKKSIRYASSDEEILKWIQKRSEKNGFTLQSSLCEVTDKKWYDFFKIDKKTHVKFKSATVEGTLTVTDTSLFTKMLVNGIGREKAYGMGMLTVASVN